VVILMRYAQVLVYETDGRLADSLRGWAHDRGVWLREVRQLSACLNLLRRGGAGVLVLKIGRDLGREIALLERVTWLLPETAIIVVCESEHPGLPALAWDLGAHYVFGTPPRIERLPEIIQGLLPASRPS
jgi:DNA-binding NtrC family response regulator